MNTTVKVWISPEAIQDQAPVASMLAALPELELVEQRSEAELVVVGSVAEIDIKLLQDLKKFVILYRCGASVLVHYLGSWRGWKRVGFCEGKPQSLFAAVAGFVRAKVLSIAIERCGGESSSCSWVIERRSASWSACSS